MKVKLADIIREAADSFLSTEDESNLEGPTSFSCDTIGRYLENRYGFWCHRAVEEFFILIETMGLDSSVNAFNAFPEFCWGIERQSVRYAWLEQVALVAEDEGIEVEIED